MNPLFSRLIIPLRDFIYPPVCLTCDSMLDNARLKVCSRCWDSLKQIHAGARVWSEISEKFAAEGVVKSFLSCFLLEKEGKMQEMVHLLKYRGMRLLGERLGEEIARRMMQRVEFSCADYLIPVPLHNLKQRERGYNQSECLCKGISNVIHIPVSLSLILRTKYTTSQTKLNLQERRENVGEAFAVNQKLRSQIKGKIFILVDDVITTGSTINACARELLSHGAECVFAASAALAE